MKKSSLLLLGLFVAITLLVTAGFAFLSGEKKTAQIQDPSTPSIPQIRSQPVPSDEKKVYQAMDTFKFLSGVIVDPDRHAVYLMNPQDGIDAVDLSSGKLIWSTGQAAKPLLLYDNLLVAQAEVPGLGNILRIVVLNTDNSGEKIFEAGVELPDDVWASVDDGLGISFQASAYMHGDNLIVSWVFSIKHISGVPSADPTERSRQVTGAVRLDLETGRIARLESDKVPAPSEPPLPDNVAWLVESGALPGPLLRAGSVVAIVTRTGNDRREDIILRRWHAGTGESLPAIALFDDGFTFRYASADGRHLLGSKAAETNGPAWAWSIHSVETGEHIAEVRRPSPAAPFFIWNSILFHESPPTGRLISGTLTIEKARRLQAIDIKSGAELWDRPIRDTTYRGPYPPELSR